MYAFAGDQTLVTLQGYTKSVKVIKAAIDAIPEDCSNLFTDPQPTNLNGAVISALQLLDTRSQLLVNNAQYLIGNVVLFTDGEDNTAWVPSSTAASAVAATTHNVYAVGLGSVSTSTLQSFGKTGWTAATSSGGLATAFVSAAQALTQALSNSFVVGYCSPKRSGTHTLEIGMKGQTTGTRLSVPFSANGFSAGCKATYNLTVPGLVDLSPPPPPPPPPPPLPPPAPRPHRRRPPGGCDHRFAPVARAS